MKRFVIAALAVALVLAVVVLGGCTQGGTTQTGTTEATETAQTKGPVTVGSKIDTEGDLLANMIVIALEKNGFKVDNKAQTGTTDVVRKALLNGEIDIYPEYTGSGLIFFENQDPAVYKDPEKGYETVKKLDLEQNKVVWLTPAKANNTWAVAAKEDFVKSNGLETMSDFAQYVNDGGKVKLAGSDEFFTNKDAFPQFQETYAFELKDNQKVVLSGGNTAQTEKAVADGTDDVNFGMAYGTDGGLAELGLVVLTDDKNAQLVYWPTPIAREEVITANPEIETILKPIFDSLDLAKLQELNAKIQVGGESANKVAEDYLKQNGFIQ
ncbi:MAG: ABC transporter substrate-binding protein [Coriobacteriales bacterium]|nr:ABC transporter substrate-binding protein [Coriobacteriales bacterium]